MISNSRGIFSFVAIALLLIPHSPRIFAADAEPKPILTIVFTGEAHGALLPCDCPLQPIGGVARRAAAIARLRAQGPVLVVDAGGWGAGGIYDEDSDGNPQRDAFRTRLMAQAMLKMDYGVITAASRELNTAAMNLGRPAEVGAVSIPSPSGAINVFVELRSHDRDERLFLSSPPPLHQDPGAVAAPRIVLSRLGEKDSSALAASLKEETLVINAARKSSQRIAWRAGLATVANFDFQAKSLGIAEIFPADPASGRKFDIRVRMVALTPDIPDDPAIAKVLAPHSDNLKKKSKHHVEIEFWTMPECPGCSDARPQLAQLAEDLRGRAQIMLRFVTHNEDGKLAALHGERELREAHVQAVIQKYYPEKIWRWLEWREKHRDAAWEDGARELGLLSARISGALRHESAALLEADHELMLRRQVASTPTLVVGNRVFEDSLERLRILRALCGMLDDPKPEACKNVPACFFDAQCRKRGYIGRCIDAGQPAARCDHSQKAVYVPAIVIHDRDNLFDNRDRIVAALIGDLPGIDFRVLDISEPEARDLAGKLKLTRLPAYVLDPIAKTEAGYADNVGKVVTDDTAQKKLVLKSFAVGAHRLLNRPRINGRADLFVSRMSKNGQEALETALEFEASTRSALDLVIHDALYWRDAADAKPPRELAAANGLAEIQEAAIAMAVRKIAPEKLNAYFLERGKQRGALFWDVPLKNLGIDAVKVRELAEKPSGEILKALEAEANLLKSIESGGEITLLAENCELIPIRSRKDLRDILERIGLRRTRNP